MHDMFHDMLDRIRLLNKVRQTRRRIARATAHKVRREVDHDHAIALLDQLQYIVRHIPRDIAHGVDGDVAQIDDHAQSVHFQDQVVAGFAYATVVRFRGYALAVDGDDSSVRVQIVAVPR
ncbi:hypothetical protein LTR33_009073 [Friedmanniomyces endolithicus]|nr:hypothetical protein LTR33_009073 [Friedmanniomyces endolithicus]